MTAITELNAFLSGKGGSRTESARDRARLPLEEAIRPEFWPDSERRTWISDESSGHDDRSDMKVWLSEEETERLLATAENTEQRVAFALGVHCGLRSGKWLDVTPRDAVDTDVGLILRV